MSKAMNIPLTLEDASDQENLDSYNSQAILNSTGIDVRFLDQDAMPAASVVIEVVDNKLMVYCWGPEDVDDPSHEIVVVDDLRQAQARKDSE